MWTITFSRNPEITPSVPEQKPILQYYNCYDEVAAKVAVEEYANFETKKVVIDDPMILDPNEFSESPRLVGEAAYDDDYSYGVTDMDLSDLTIPVEKWEHLNGLFSGKTLLKTLDLSGWDVSNLESMYGMFAGCSALTSVNVSD